MFRSCLIFCSLKLPIQHDPMPRLHAVSTMVCSAIVVSMGAHFPVSGALALAQPTMMAGAFSRNRLRSPFICFLVSGSVTMTNLYGCLLAAEGDCLPASIILSRISRGIGLFS